VSFGSVTASACRDSAAPLGGSRRSQRRRQPSGSGQHLLGVTDCSRRATQEQLHDELVSICICDIVSMLRMSMHGVRMFTE
jgi:hypothetical protein